MLKLRKLFKGDTAHLVSVLSCIGGAGYIISAFCSNIMEGVFGTGLAVMGGRLLDAIFAHDRPSMDHIMLVSLLLGAGLFLSIMSKDYLIGLYLERGLINLKRKTIQALNFSKLSWLDGMHTGELSSRITNDLNSLTGSLRPVLILGISWTVAQLVSFLYMLFTDFKLTLVIFVFVPPITYLQWHSSRSIKQHKAKNLEAAGEMSSVAGDCFGAHETVKSLSLEKEMLERFEAAQRKQVIAASREVRTDAVLTPLSLLCEWLPRIALFFFGGRSVMQGGMSLGQLMVFIALGNRTIIAFSGMLDLYVAVRRLSASCVRIAGLWDVPVERDNGEVNKLGKDDGFLVFSNVSFAYDPVHSERQSLNGISFSAGKGEFIALVGESGCGKSTILKLTASLYEPEGGNISFSGSDMGEWDLKSLRERIAYVTQETFLFAGTVLENLTCGRTDIEADRINAAIEAAGLTDFINSLPSGLETQIGERGVLISGGQRQRLSIARAVICRTELLLLDEATSALDRKTESEVFSSLVMLRHKPTLVVAAHRLSTVKGADCIYVIEKGRIAEKGTHEELLALGGIYSRMLARAGEGELNYAT